MSSLLSNETLQELRENAAETAAKFGIYYSINAAWTIYERAREAAEKKEPTKLKLTYRDFDSVVRTDLLTGYVDVKVGEGPGAMRGWKKVYCVERSDYGIEFYANRGAYERHRPPKTTIQPAGYKVLTQDIAKPFRKLIEPIARGLDVDPSALDGMVDFKHGCWALFHPQRTKYVFRICKKPRFERNKKKPATRADEQIDRKDWIYFLRTCVRKAKPRNTDTVLGMAFEQTCKSIPEKVDALKDWTDDGTEDEMLLEMVMTSCLPSVRDIVLEEIKGRLSIPIPPLRSFAATIASRVLIPIWYTAVGLIKKTIQSVLAVAWTKIQEGAQALLDKLEPTLRKGLAPITKIHNKIIDLIKAAASQTIGRLLTKFVTPLIENLIKAYARPLTEGFDFVRETYWASVVTEDTSWYETKRKEYLDAIPRKRDAMKTCYLRALRLSKGLDPAKRAIERTLKTIEDGRKLIEESTNMIEINNNKEEENNNDDHEEQEMEDDAEELCAKAEDSLLGALDAIVYTLYLRLENGEQMNEDLVDQLLTKELDHDVILLKRDIVKKGIRQFVFKYFRMIINTDNELSQAIGSVDKGIPSEMRDILCIQSIFDGVINIAIGEPIDRMVEAAMIFKLNEPAKKERKKNP